MQILIWILGGTKGDKEGGRASDLYEMYVMKHAC